MPKTHRDEAPNEVMPEQVLPLNTILNALLNEAIRSRLRNRALLTILAKNGHITMPQYLDAFKHEEESDFETLADLLLLPYDQFSSLHADWIESEGNRFGFVSGAKRIELKPVSDAPSAERQDAHKPKSAPKKSK